MSAGQSQSGPRAVSPSVNGWNAEFLDAEYGRFKADPGALPPDTRAFFQGFELGLATPATATSGVASPFQSAVDELIAAYRELGHLAAAVDPLGRRAPRPSSLTLAGHGLSDADLTRTVETTIIPGKTAATLREIIDHLETVYCGSVGSEFMHLPDEAERAWFLRQLEGREGFQPFSADKRTTILAQLTSAEIFDKFLGKRYQGKKRFSLEGGESLIPLLKGVTDRAGALGVREIIMGMAHRGRLSVLRNYLGKDLERLFTEFEDSWHDPANELGGDVKYHRGYSGDHVMPDGRVVHISMLNNPSHLESVNPIVMGRCRAKQELAGDAERRQVISLLIHGDAAVAGQGVVTECLTMSQLEGYAVGGTIHVVINNLVGFTTDPSDARSTVYCTDVAKMVNAPVLHVNGDDPEAVVHAAFLAAEFRHHFRRDIFIDLVCFRRYGHNEQDEPTYTQPTLYALVKAHPGTPQKYRDALIAGGVLSSEVAQAQIDAEQTALDAGQAAARAKPVNPVPAPFLGSWQGLQGRYTFESPPTAISPKTLAEICAAYANVPDGFNVHPKLKALLQTRAGLAKAERISHADAEQLAFGSLLLENTAVRLSGQDARRGTFTQRHAVLRDEQTGVKWTPLNSIRPGQQAALSVWDSPLSEFGVMGFDYGYSRGSPRTLVLWEAQFGDFVNGAQIIIDQYLSSSEAKWNRWAGLVLLLPHGYEGQGPEHSSARLERFLQLCAEDNMEVVYPSTGAQTFHLLRRQARRDFRKPLIVMAPKKFLRIETSNVSELTQGAFQHLIDDPRQADSASARGVRKVIYCSGKIYHELDERRTQTGTTDVAIVRVEQLYPLHAALLKRIDGRYPSAASRVWVQEEPRNQGAFLYAADAFRELAGISLGYIGRPASASPATGSEHNHKKQQDRILTEAVADAAQKPTAESKPATKPGASPAAPASKSKR